ncbi:MAG TPA: hypothetical protein VGS09_06770 [Actinomycetota bacterium]|nr:hypothetical protein [Actinomycetota bacterium]
MSDNPRHLHLLESPAAATLLAEDDPWSESRSLAFLHQWRAEKIARSMAMHPTSLARATALPALRLVP